MSLQLNTKEINILSTEKNGYETLSNILSPPVTVDIDGVSIKFKTVEHAYQYVKAMFFNFPELAELILNSKTGWDAKRLSKTLKTNEEWDSLKVAILCKIMYECFSQNSSHKSLLLKTGESTLTHKHPKFSLGEWETVFPRILMTLRQTYKDA